MAAGQSVWGSRSGFIFASVGFAVGLGNIWRFPYVTGENGGSAFVLIYLACAIGIGVPILMAELLLGRRGQKSPPFAIAAVAVEAGLSRRWSWVGNLTVLTAFSILTSYAVVAGWVLYYFYLALAGHMLAPSASAAEAAFAGLMADPLTLVFWGAVALVGAATIIASGVQQGIERAVKILMPMLFALLVALMVFNIFVGGMPAALNYLFTPDFSKVDGGTFLAALSQAFFSIGVAMAGMMMFGAYLPKSISIARSALIIVAADTLVALLAGLVIFPMVFHNGLDVAAGTGLIFQTLPVAFSRMDGGAIVGAAFFLLLCVAAVTSIVGLSEPVTGFLAERLGLSRRRATLVTFAALFPFTVISALSYNNWSDVAILGQSLAYWIDYLPNQVMLPVGGLLIAVLVAWRVPLWISENELNFVAGRWFRPWSQLMRYVVAPAVFMILLSGL
ncbi:MAG: sodium-dependent transporter [Proteobacteria bacterium]|nr:sodium-dependent transporter [Pseudomonadota bacterium]